MARRRDIHNPYAVSEVVEPPEEIAGRVAWGCLSSIGAVLIGAIAAGIVAGVQGALCADDQSAVCSIALILVSAAVAVIAGMAIMVTILTLAKRIDFWFFAAFTALFTGLLAIQASLGVNAILDSWLWWLYLLVPALSALASARWTSRRPLAQKIALIAAPVAAAVAFAAVCVV
ncbi:MAG: hypothetical protein LBI99_11290 [Propionibacteriaceae bacterium]|jgi:hypothetical protein|nr:hypothetical protein [Propionibacteriaceae bacterium]